MGSAILYTDLFGAPIIGSTVPSIPTETSSSMHLEHVVR